MTDSRQTDTLREAGRVYQIALERVRWAPQEEEAWEELDEARVILERAWLEWRLVA